MNPIFIGAIVGGLIGVVISIILVINQNKINKGKATATKNKRFSTSLAFEGSQEELDKKLDEFLVGDKFVKQSYGDGMAYRKGSGTMTASRFVSYRFEEKMIYLDAFVILFGAVESDLEGFTGIIVKKPLKKTVSQIVEIISSHK